MNQQEQLSAQKIARLMRTARKSADLNQVQVAKHLGISQGALSRTENGILIPSAPQWFSFCQLTGIAADTIVTGLIEKTSPAVIDSNPRVGGFKLPKKYAENKGSKVRSLLPFLNYFEAVCGQEKLDRYLESRDVDPDFFVDVDNQISFGFGLDISEHLIRNGHLNPRNLTRLMGAVNQSQTHGSLQRAYDSAYDAANRLQLLFMNSKFYEVNFDYKILDTSKSKVTFSITPQKHLEQHNYRENDILGDFVCQYKKKYFENFASTGNRNHAEVLEEKECLYHGAERCVYQMKIA